MITFITKQMHNLKRGTDIEMWKEAKWMLPYVKRYWKYILFYIILGAAGTGMGLAGSIASKYLIDAVTGYNSPGIVFIIIIIISMALGNIVVNAVSGRISAVIELKVNNEIRADIYEKIMYTDWEAISGYHSGDLLNRFGTDVSAIADSVIGWIPSLFTRTLQFIGSLAIILYYDVSMAVIALISAPLTLIMSRFLMTRMREYSKNVRKISSDMMSFNEESFQNIQIIKCFDLIKSFQNKFKKIQNSYTTISMDYNKFTIYTSSLMSVVGLGVSYATFGWGVYRLWGGHITFGTMTLFIQLSGYLSGSFSALIGMVPAAIQATTAAGRIMEIADLPSENEKVSSNRISLSHRIKNHNISVKLSHIDYGYSDRDLVLKDINFQTKPREIVAVIGPSGEGKTTLMRILLGMIRPMCGEAKIIDSYGVEESISDTTRRFFSYVPQENTMFSGTIADNLRLIQTDASEEQLIAALKAACAYDFVFELAEGLNTIIKERGGGFSEGQIQRLSIARAILRDAPILLLDEATSALDVETELCVLQGIMAYGKTHACILTTHRKSVLTMCDRVYCIEKTQMSQIQSEESVLAVDF